MLIYISLRTYDVFSSDALGQSFRETFLRRMVDYIMTLVVTKNKTFTTQVFQKPHVRFTLFIFVNICIFITFTLNNILRHTTQGANGHGVRVSLFNTWIND